MSRKLKACCYGNACIGASRIVGNVRVSSWGRVAGRGFRSNRPQCAATRATPYRRSRTPACCGRRSRAKRRCPRQCWLTGFGGRRPFAQWVDTALRPISFRSIAPTQILQLDRVDRGLDGSSGTCTGRTGSAGRAAPGEAHQEVVWKWLRRWRQFSNCLV